MFIMTPTAMECRQFMPASLATTPLPRNLPPDATSRMYSRSRPCPDSERVVRSMDKPVTMKKSGSSTSVANGSTLVRMVYRNGVP